MRITRGLLFLLALVLPSILSTHAGRNSVVAQENSSASKVLSPLRVANIEDSSVVDTCGCYFQFPVERRRQSQKFVLMENLEKVAWMNIEGKDVKLRLVDSSRAPSEPKVGECSYRIFKAGNVMVRVDDIVTSVCGPNEQPCESTGYSATINVLKGDRRQVLKVEGACGC